eukprot:5927540-Amphidinium_carterae.1
MMAPQNAAAHRLRLSTALSLATRASSPSKLTVKVTRKPLKHTKSLLFDYFLGHFAKLLSVFVSVAGGLSLKEITRFTLSKFHTGF